MSDVFVSYKAEDRRRIRPLVETLEADGYSVWWDEQIGGGAAWRHAILAELNAAKCIIVAWSKRSVGPEGTFVQDEAARAQKRHVYVPVTIDKVHPPLGFGETQALPLTGWKGDRSDPRYQAVLAAVRRLAGDAGQTPVARKITHAAISRRALVGGGAVAAAAAAGVGAWALLKPGSGAAADSIAVLPFANLSGDPAQAYFSAGISEEIRSALSRIAQLKVVARTSSEMVGATDAKTAARTLGVTNILTGSVRRSPSTIRVAAQLVDGEDGIERWSEVYDRPTGDVLQIQSDIAASVVQALSIELGQGARTVLASGGTNSPQALDLFLRADPGLSEHGEAGYRKALALIDAAIALDPNYAEAHARKALLLNFLAGSYARSAAESRAGLTEAAEVAKRAIQLAPNISYGYLTLAAIQANQLAFAEALATFERGREMPGRTIPLRGYALLLGRLKRHREAEQQARALVPLDPLNPTSHQVLAHVLYDARRYAQALPIAERAVGLGRRRSQSRDILANIQLMLGRVDEAQRNFALMPEGDTYRLTGEALVAARRGDKRKAKTIMAELTRLYRDGVNYQLGEIHAQLGERNDAIAALDRAWSARDAGLQRMLIDPHLDPVRSDPRFEAQLQRLNFPGG